MKHFLDLQVPPPVWSMLAMIRVQMEDSLPLELHLSLSQVEGLYIWVIRENFN